MRTSRSSAPETHDPAATGVERARRGSDQHGFTFVEIAVTIGLLSLVLASVVPVVTSFYFVSDAVQGTYSSVNAVILPSEIMSDYIRNAVAPASGDSAFCGTSCAVASDGTQATFYVDVGSPLGPERVIAKEVATGSTKSLLVTTQLPDTAPDDCPPSGPGCTYGGQAGAKASELKVLENIPDLDVSSGPVFTYYSCLPSSTCLGTSTPTNAELTSVSFVGLNIKARVGTGSPSQIETLTHLLAPSFDPSVG